MDDTIEYLLPAWLRWLNNQYNFNITPEMVDLLLNYAMYVDIKNEFDSLIKAYFTLYPDSVENYIGYYNGARICM